MTPCEKINLRAPAHLDLGGITKDVTVLGFADLEHFVRLLLYRFGTASGLTRRMASIRRANQRSTGSFLKIVDRRVC